MSDPRYPVGKFQRPSQVSAEDRAAFIQQIAQTPEGLRAAVRRLSDAQLDTPYREGGWSVRQVVHHVADSHMNAYCRLRLALTEETPTIKPYAEAAWATLSDASTAPVETSLTLLESLHSRWVWLLKSLTPEQWARTVQYPESGRMDLDTLAALYAWHGRHHTAHVTSLREAQGW